MRISTVSFLLFLILVTSCGGDEEDFDLGTVLTAGNTKHWDLAKNDWYFPSYGLSFRADGSYQNFLYNKQDRKCLYEGASDVVVPNTWSVVSDSVLLLGNNEFIVQKVSNDFMILSLISKPKFNMVLVKSELQSDSVVKCW